MEINNFVPSILPYSIVFTDMVIWDFYDSALTWKYFILLWVVAGQVQAATLGWGRCKTCRCLWKSLNPQNCKGSVRWIETSACPACSNFSGHFRPGIDGFLREWHSYALGQKHIIHYEDVKAECFKGEM